MLHCFVLEASPAQAFSVTFSLGTENESREQQTGTYYFSGYRNPNGDFLCLHLNELDVTSHIVNQKAPGYCKLGFTQPCQLKSPYRSPFKGASSK